MIGKLTGVLSECDGAEGMIDTPSGVSYRVFLPPSITSQPIPAQLTVYTYLHVREDQQVLYGFDSLESYKMFQMLVSVDGIGPKTAHMILSHVSVTAIVHSIHSREIDVFTKIPGLGKKSAQKILLELSSKLKSELDVKSLLTQQMSKDALDTLQALGYRVSDAREMLKDIDSQLPVEDQVKLALTTKR